jgi:hypothetical protein
MKCIQCQVDNKLKDRTANFGRCLSCNHQFAFEPTAMTTVKVTDPMFKKTLDELSANNTLFFTEKQLIYFLDKRLRRSPIATGMSSGCLYLFMNVWFTGFFGGFSLALIPMAMGIGIKLPALFSFVAANFVWQGITMWSLYKNSISTKLDARQRKSSAQNLRKIGLLILLLGSAISVIIAPSFILFIAAVILGIGGIYLGNQSLGTNLIQEVLIQPNEIKGWLKRWQEVNGTVVRLLAPAIKKKGIAEVDRDVTAYSFDRLVVCQTAEVAQMLISNNFHFENNCAILSIYGYPEDIFDVTMQMLRRNTDLKVYLLHDCSPEGMRMLHQLKSSDRWFKDSNIAIIDIGLTPNQVMTSKHLFVKTSTASAQKAKYISPSEWTGLSLDEVSWLTEGNHVELESFTPQQLIQVLNQGIAGTLNILDGNDSYMTIGGYDGSIYAAESFG